ncbi:MAG: peptidylprolyl isomerase, partial [Acidobacteria bacterium]|nr:peptidylprolyl isomerase [Acidobacteriota bacterium]
PLPPGETKDVKKANQRPDEPAQKPEPFDDADVKTMASKCVVLKTGKGDISIELFPESAPQTVRNFLNLTAIKAFDNTTFSRVVPDFVIQGGDLWTNKDITIDMKWRASRTIPDEPNLIKHVPGIVSMARGDEPNSASTSFFILLTDYEGLDGKFTAFGRVKGGMDVVTEINKMPGKDEKPDDPVVINSAIITPCADQAETKGAI